jgi:hypothetical protein
MTTSDDDREARHQERRMQRRARAAGRPVATSPARVELSSPTTTTAERRRELSVSFNADAHIKQQLQERIIPSLHSYHNSSSSTKTVAVKSSSNTPVAAANANATAAAAAAATLKRADVNADPSHLLRGKSVFAGQACDSSLFMGSMDMPMLLTSRVLVVLNVICAVLGAVVAAQGLEARLNWRTYFRQLYFIPVLFVIFLTTATKKSVWKADVDGFVAPMWLLSRRTIGILIVLLVILVVEIVLLVETKPSNDAFHSTNVYNWTWVYHGCFTGIICASVAWTIIFLDRCFDCVDWGLNMCRFAQRYGK